jgi:hypothetical protein
LKITYMWVPRVSERREEEEEEDKGH